MEKMTICCGTYHAESFDIDLDKYGTAVPTDADEETWRTAFNLLHETMDDKTFADDGCRNEDAVNGCIALHVMGYDALAWFESFCAEQGTFKDRWFKTDLDKFMEHVERVCKYLHRWGPVGRESEALAYTI